MQQTNVLQVQAAQKLLSVMETFTKLRHTAAALTSDLHSNQAKANHRLEEVCRRLRELEPTIPSQGSLSFTQSSGKAFSQKRAVPSGLFLRHTAPSEVNDFRDNAAPQPNLCALEKFRIALVNPPDKFTISRPEYFLDCWLEEERSRQKAAAARRQTKRHREEEAVVIPAVVRKRINEFGESVVVTVGEEKIVHSHSLSSRERSGSFINDSASDSESDEISRSFPTKLEAPASGPLPPPLVPLTAVTSLGLPPRPSLQIKATFQLSEEKPDTLLAAREIPFQHAQPSLVEEEFNGIETAPAETKVVRHEMRQTPTPHEEINISDVSNSWPVQKPVTMRLAPLSFQEQIQARIDTGLADSNARVLKPLPPKPDDIFAAIRRGKDLNPVGERKPRPARVPAVHPLFKQLEKMRDLINPNEATGRRQSLDSNNSDFSDDDSLH